MRFSRWSIGSLAFLFSLFTFISSPSYSCTGLQLTAKDGSTVNGRTVEFGIPLDLAGLVIPRNYTFKGTLPNGEIGLIYTSKYAAVGANAFGAPAILDGVNEKGLSAGAFYFPGYATYATINKDNSNRALAPTEFVNWILTQFATVDEVKQNISSVVIAPTGPQQWGGAPPFHYVVYDKTGKSIVIEPVDGQLKVYDNPIGVITNSPGFDWHITNLSNYVNLSPMNAPNKQIDGVQIKQFGQGSGLRGLPGDFTPPSRFVRAAIFSNTAVPVKTANQAVLQAFHILNQFDIPVGSVRGQDGDAISTESTIATSVKDTKNAKYYLRTYSDQTIKVINLKAFNLDAKQLKMVGITSTQSVVDISSTAKEAMLASLH